MIDIYIKIYKYIERNRCVDYMGTIYIYMIDIYLYIDYI